jgi:hypothetical protein
VTRTTDTDTVIIHHTDTPVVIRPVFSRTEILVLRACFAHGELGDWDVDAIKKHLVESDGLSKEAADAAVDGCVQTGILTLDVPPSADILEFPSR